jgi:WD repeat-containing protein 17
MEDEVAEMKLKAICGAPWKDLCSSPAEAIAKPGTVALCGKKSAEFPTRLNAALAEQERQRLISNFFTGVDGTTELWDLVVSLLTGQRCPSGNRVIHTRELIAKWEGCCSELEQVRSQGFAQGIGAARKEDRLSEAASIRLRLGQFREYCEIQVELGRWYEALAIAPAVSLQYWQSLCARYSQTLAEKGNPEAEKFIVAAGETARITDYFCDHGRVGDAILVAQAAAVRAAQPQPQAQSKPQDKPDSPRRATSATTALVSVPGIPKTESISPLVRKLW